MSVPRFLTARLNRVANLPARSALAFINHSKATFALSTHQGLHTGTLNLRRPLAAPSSTSTVAATLTSLPRSVCTLNNNRPLLAPIHINSCQHYSISTPLTNNGQKPPLFATSSLYADDKRVFFFDIDNCLYPKTSGIHHLMKARIEQYFRDSGISHRDVERLAHRYYVDYGLAIRGLIERHPEVDIRDYDNKVDGGLPLEKLLTPNPKLRAMIESMKVGKKWLFTNAGENHARRVIRILELEGLFHGMTFCNYLEPQFACKPDRKSFTKAMREAGVRDQDSSLCFFADDSAPNVDMAVKMGWTAVHVMDKFKDLPSTSGQYQIESLVDLPTVLPQFWR
ncbi:pyrimidine 5-nucleotidase [Linnemannia elongata AG-77]|uniref:Pyrimidine 5-nucleotidase n=1 Tax=Linnemannia elongata AG-77 TaxID=1314771 RepID=A0A197K905_9FUNG|nr:pyrimidine 5-nucleotidase [Linnemannia elongata AG-77]